MEDYKSNSNKSKEKKIEKVVTGGFKTITKNETFKLSDIFSFSDIKSVKSYILKDILIPSIIKTIDNVICNGTHMFFYGKKGDERREYSSGLKPSYRSYYEKSASNTVNQASRRELYSFDTISFNSSVDAHELLEEMRNVCEQYGLVSVADMYDMVGYAKNFTDNKYGWTDLRSAKVVFYESKDDSGWIIEFPKVLAL